jgi:GNAT superfamily N-acetyltransferase
VSQDDFRIRRATKKDRETLLRFHHGLYVQHRDLVMPEKLSDFYGYRDLSSALAEDVDSILHSTNGVALIGLQGTDPVGYITGHIESDARRTLPTKGVVEDWFVAPASRGTRVGARLMEKLIEIFNEAGCDVVESTTWPFNETARKSHTALGFHEVEIKYRRRLR